VPTAVVATKGREPDEVAGDMLRALEEHGIEIVLLAGYLKLIPGDVVARYSRRMLNVHPALLPAFGGAGMYGMHVHRAVLASGARISGATVHYVDEEYDRGPIIGQWPVPVLIEDTPEALAARVLRVEHRLYPRVVDHVCAALRAGRDPGPYVEAGESFRLETHTFSTKESVS
jgi:folate-dependent phosphoribosylglycinamide formyltransferase PurN